jgi:large subunit ribosomal protein L7/L12
VDELALGLSLVALAVSLLALSRSARREPTGPVPNVLSTPASDLLPGEPASMTAGVATGGPSAVVMQYLAAGKKIQAIKQYRIETGMGLKEAKDAIDELDRRRPIANG